MILRVVILIGLAYSFLPIPSSAQLVAANTPSVATTPSAIQPQDFSHIVFPITTLKIRSFGPAGKLEVGFGTGFCLDPGCQFVGTNYHVALLEHPRKIRGEKVIQKYLATGPKDEGATTNYLSSGRFFKYTLSRDLAIFVLSHPIPGYHGIAFDRDDLQIGQEVDIYVYPKRPMDLFRSLQRFHGKFRGVTQDSLLAFDYELSGDKAIQPGASGGIVVDSASQRIVGILNGIESHGRTIVVAVPVQALANFVNKVQPFLAQSIFPMHEEVSAVTPDFYPPFVPNPSDVLQRRSQEPEEIRRLRNKAQALKDSMRNYIAVQTYVWGAGSANNRPSAAAAYEVRVVEGSQTWREYPDGKKERSVPPIPNIPAGISPGDDWSTLPDLVGTKLGFRIHQAPDVVVHNRRLKVFQYEASAEDSACAVTSVYDFELFSISKTRAFPSYGEVWTDEDTNILRISEHCVRSGNWGLLHEVVTYGWLRLKDNSQHLVPIAIAAQTDYKKKVYWCRGQFVNYREFVSRTRLVHSAEFTAGVPTGSGPGSPTLLSGQPAESNPKR